MNTVVSYLKHPYVPYIFPFALFAVFTYAGPFFNISPGLTYAFKTVAVCTGLVYFRNTFKQEIRPSFSWLAVISGVLIFIIWILSEGLYPQIGHSEFNPFVYAGVLYHRKDLFDSILSHATTNLLLGIYVLSTHHWSFW